MIERFMSREFLVCRGFKILEECGFVDIINEINIGF